MDLPIREFKVLLYGPGLHAAGVRASARFADGTLAVVIHNGSFSIPPLLLQLNSGGFDGRQWILSWPAKEGTYSAMLQGDDALEAFIRLAPKALAKQLRQARKAQARGTRRFSLGVGLLVLLLSLPVLVVALLWWQSDRLSQWVVSHISLEQETALGDLAFRQLQPRVQLLDQGELQAAIQSIGERLTSESNYRYRFHVARDQAINAYALPGGQIVVNTGLIAAVDSPGEMAGVLAHEISHVERHDSLRGMVHLLGTRAVLGVVMGTYSDTVWGDLASRLVNLSYSRELESEADREALVTMTRAGIVPHGLETFLAKLGARHHGSADFLSSHPGDEQRLADLRVAIARMDHGPYSSIPIDWDRLRLDL
jgi:Zn-dependent protease with chaperone function